MGLLDGLVSDLIRSSTGFNARPFVRMVGGKNILLLGGAAIAGALAAEKMREHEAPAVPPPPLPLPPPPLPPPSGDAGTAPPLPPLPVAAAPSGPDIPQELLFAIVRTMVSGALADGEMHTEEKQLIENRLEEGALSPEQTKQVHKDLVIPPTPEELGGMVTRGEEDREMLYRFGALVVLAEGDVSPPEKVWLERLAAALGLGAARRSALEEEIFGTTT